MECTTFPFESVITPCTSFTVELHDFVWNCKTSKILEMGIYILNVALYIIGNTALMVRIRVVVLIFPRSFHFMETSVPLFVQKRALMSLTVLTVQHVCLQNTFFSVSSDDDAIKCSNLIILNK